jgi:hypothetical protein
MPHLEYDAEANELFDVYEPLDALYDHLDTIDAEQPGTPQIPLIRALYDYLYTIPSFLALNPGVRRALIGGAENCVQQQNELREQAAALLQYLYGLHNHDDFIAG